MTVLFKEREEQFSHIMDRISTFGWGFTYERVLDAGAVSAESLIRLLSPEMATATYTFLTDEIVLFEERDRKFFLCNLHFSNHFPW